MLRDNIQDPVRLAVKEVLKAIVGFRASLEAVESHIYVTIPVVYKVVSLVRVAMILKWESSRVPESTLSPTVKSWLKELIPRGCVNHASTQLIILK